MIEETADEEEVTDPDTDNLRNPITHPQSYAKAVSYLPKMKNTKKMIGCA